MYPTNDNASSPGPLSAAASPVTPTSARSLFRIPVATPRTPDGNASVAQEIASSADDSMTLTVTSPSNEDGGGGDNSGSSEEGSQTATITARNAGEGLAAVRRPMSVSPNINASFGAMLPRVRHAQVNAAPDLFLRGNLRQFAASRPGYASSQAVSDQSQHSSQHPPGPCSCPGCVYYHQGSYQRVSFS